jgi:hypothetical protein
LIRNITSQGKLLQYWARSQSKIEVGIFLPGESQGVPWNVEYWMDLSLQLLPDAQPEDYPKVLKNLCIEKMHEISNGVAQFFAGLGDEFRIETRYLFNSVRFWLCPLGAYGARVKRPMAENPAPMDKWYAANGVMAFTFPLMEEVGDAP